MISMAFLPQISRYKECFYEKQSAFIPSLHLYSDGCSSAGSTSETANNSETESISSETASETSSESESATTASASFASLEKTDLFEQQNSIDEALQQEASAGYSFEEPNVIVNPYGNSPLTAVAAFHRSSPDTGGWHFHNRRSYHRKN